VTTLEERLIAAWQTNNQATAYLVRHLPAGVWARQVPGIPRLTVGMIAAHIHNSRCRWIKSLGAHHGVGGAASRRRRPLVTLRTKVLSPGVRTLPTVGVGT
jgi:hypothetical protein